MPIYSLKKQTQRDVLASSLLFVGCLCIYILWNNTCHPFDSLKYAYDARIGQNLFHPHHLLYTWLGHNLFELLARWGIDIFDAFTWTNAVVGSCIIAISYICIRKGDGGFSNALLCSLLIAFSGEFWKNTVTISPWHLSMLFWVISFYLAAFQLKPGWKQVLVLSITTSISCLFHQTGVFLVGCLLPFFMVRWNFMRYLSYVIMSASICFLIYYVSAKSQGSIEGFSDLIPWALYSPDNVEIYGYKGLGNLIHSVPVGIIRTFFTLALFTKVFLGKEALAFLVYAVFGLVSVFFVCLGILLIQTAGKMAKMTRLSYALLLWIAPLVVLACMWAPNEQSEWFKITVPLFLAVGIFSERSRKNSALMLICLVCLVVVNFPYNIYPNSKKENCDAPKVSKILMENGLSDKAIILGLFCPEVVPFVKMYRGIDVDIFSLSMQKKSYWNEYPNKMKALMDKIRRKAEQGKAFISENERYPDANKLDYMAYGYSMEDFDKFYGEYRLIPLNDARIVLKKGPVVLYRLIPKNSSLKREAN